jgi:hypothetical protein
MSGIEELERRLAEVSVVAAMARYKDYLTEAIDRLRSFKPKGEIVLITYFLNEDDCLARVHDSLIENVVEGDQILRAPFEIWDGYSHKKNFFIGVSVYESDTRFTAILMPLIRGILEQDINDKFQYNDESGAKILEIENIFEEKLNDLMEELECGPFIDTYFQPIEKFRIYFDWNDFNSAEASHLSRPRELEGAKVLIEGFGYNDFFHSYRRTLNGNECSVTRKADGNLYKETENEDGQFEPGDTVIPETALIKAEDGTLISCGGHYNWFNFKLKQLTIKKLPETHEQDHIEAITSDL